MKYLFILGRNTELSIAEITSFFQKERFNFKISENINNSLIVEIENPLEKGVIERFGGVISIGEVLCSGKNEEILQQLDKKILYEGKKNKLNYVLFNFKGENFEQIELYLKKRFRKEGLKATEKKLTGTIKLQSGEFVPSLSSNLIQEQYFIFKDNFGRIIERCDYEKLEKRDMEKPVRREELAISPRLAKILINLSQVKSGKTILDPFCGVGTILQEALLQKIRVIGVDIDSLAIENAKKNLDWLNLKDSFYKLINEDSSKVDVYNIEAIVSEPDLGEIQKRIPSLEKAKEILKNFELLIIKVINNLKKEVRGRIVFTSPLIKVGNKRISCDVKFIEEKTGLRLVEGFPIQEFRDNSIVGRTIIVLKKQTRNF